MHLHERTNNDAEDHGKQDEEGKKTVEEAEAA